MFVNEGFYAGPMLQVSIPHYGDLLSAHCDKLSSHFQIPATLVSTCICQRNCVSQRTLGQAKINCRRDLDWVIEARLVFTRAGQPGNTSRINIWIKSLDHSWQNWLQLWLFMADIIQGYCAD